jgi:hypothetical protein
LSGLGSIGQGIFSNYSWAFCQGFEDKMKAKRRYKMMRLNPHDSDEYI